MMWATQSPRTDQNAVVYIARVGRRVAPQNLPCAGPPWISVGQLNVRAKAQRTVAEVEIGETEPGWFSRLGVRSPRLFRARQAHRKRGTCLYPPGAIGGGHSYRYT